MDQMYKICDRLIWIDKGLIRDEGIPKFIGEAYLADMEGRRLDRIEWEQQQKKAEIDRKLAEEKKRQEEERKRQEEKRKRQEENRIRAERERQLKEDEIRRRKEEEERKQAEIAELERKKKEYEINETAKALTDFCRPGARRQGTWDVHFTKVRMRDSSGEETQRFKINDEITIEMEYAGKADVDVNYIIGFTRLDGVFCYGSTVRLDCKKMLKSKEEGVVVFKVKNTLMQGKYVLDVRIRAEDESFIDNIYSLLEFESYTDNVTDAGVMVMEHEWYVDGERVPVNK